jgi:hypothetical protein
MIVSDTQWTMSMRKKLTTGSREAMARGSDLLVLRLDQRVSVEWGVRFVLNFKFERATQATADHLRSSHVSEVFLGTMNRHVPGLDDERSVLLIRPERGLWRIPLENKVEELRNGLEGDVSSLEAGRCGR